MKLQDSINLLREVMSFGTFGAYGGAHSYPGPEPGKVGVFSPGYAWPMKSSEVPAGVRKLPGQFREKIRKVRRWRSQKY